MIKQFGSAAVFALVLIGCADETVAPDSNPLEMDVSATTITGTFVHAGSVIEFRSELIEAQRAVLHLDVNGSALDVDLDLGAGVYSDDGHLNALDADDRAALLALRDAIGATRPDLIDALHGMLLVRHADRMAEAPIGATMDKQFVDLSAATASRFENRADADGCGGDGATCLYGTGGWDYAVYDGGNDGYCSWQWAPYGSYTGNCTGRCGAGCNWFDNDYTWDCFDHDKCVDAYGGSVMSDNYNCGDEFWDASDDYALTYGPWC